MAYLDRIVFKIREDKRVIDRAIYPALVINAEGHKELPGLCQSVIGKVH
jgi:transposase-like protein